MADDDGSPVFPLIDRRTPVMDRLRQRQGSEDVDGVPSDLAQAVSESVMTDDEEESKESSQQAQDEFRVALADTFGVDPSQIKDSFVSQVGKMFGGLTEQDVLTTDALKELGLHKGSDGEEEEGDGDGEEEESFLD